MARRRTYNPHETARMKELEGAELAGFWRRAVAFFLDFAFFGAFFLGTLVAFGKLAKHFGWLGDRHIHLELNFFHNWYSVLYLVICYGLSLWVGKGQTLGKKLLGIRVVSLAHSHMGLWHCVERALGYGASALELGFGFVQFFMNPNRRTVHDRIAETIVVRVRK